MTEDEHRALVARLAAQRFLISFLLRHVFWQEPSSERSNLADAILQASKRTTQFSDVAKGDDHAAERLSDLVIQIQGLVEGMVQEALEACRIAESDTKPPTA